MLKQIITLANRFNARITRTADTDALESYPGEDSSNRTKLESASKAVIDDLHNISSTYHMYESQHHQTRREMNHQAYLLQFAKRVQELIKKLLATDSEINIDELGEQIANINREAIAFGKEHGTRISLSELHSLRLLKAMIADEIAKNQPKLPPPDWVALSKQKRQEDLASMYETTKSSPYAAPFMDDEEATTTHDLKPFSETLRSPEV